MNNPYFPTWKEANMCISKIAKSIRPYITIGDDSGTVVLSFLPQNVKLEQVPPDVINQLDSRYGAFSEWATEKLDIETLTEEYLGKQINDERTKALLENDINRKMAELEIKMDFTFQDYFLQYMGVIIPFR